MAGPYSNNTGATFAASVEAWVADSKARMLQVAENAIGDMIEDAQKPVSKGGQMRVKTGFLRASARASLEGMPSGPNVRPVDAVDGQFEYEGSQVTSVLATMDLGDTVYFGWTANYAEVRDTYDGFLSLRLQNWQKYVDDAVNELKRSEG